MKKHMIFSVAVQAFALAAAALAPSADARAASDDGYGAVFYRGKGAQVVEMKVKGSVLEVTTEFGETFGIGHWSESGAKQTLADIWNGKSLNLDKCIFENLDRCVFDKKATEDLTKAASLSGGMAQLGALSTTVFEVTWVTSGAYCGADQFLDWVGAASSYAHAPLKGMSRNALAPGSSLPATDKCTYPGQAR